MRIGFGYDVHALAEGESLILGGVALEHNLGTVAHSDGDVLAHAITDALLGALALGDIGTHFPDTDPKWKDADSLELLKEAMKLISLQGYRIGNIDATIALQLPRLRPHIDTMRRNIGQCLAVNVSDVSIKATTTEHLGFEGRQEGVSAYAVCLLLKSD